MVQLRSHRLLLRIALPALTLVLLYTVVGFFVVPRLVRSGVHDFVAKNYHRDAAIGDVRFNPYTLRLDVRNFALHDADGQPMLSFAHLLVDLTVASVWRRGLDFESILLEQPFTRIIIKSDGTLNLSELELPPSPDARPEPNPKPARLFINRLSVQGGNVAFEDRAHPSEFRTEIKPVTFELRNFSTVGKNGGTYSLGGTSEAGERFSWSGSLSAHPLASRGRFEIGSLQAQTIWSYLRDSVHFELPSGVISIIGDYDFTTATTPIGLSVNVHDVTVTDLGVRPKGAADDYVRLGRLEVREARADVAKHTVDVGSVHLAGGEVRAWMPGAGGGALNLMELLGEAEPPSTAPPPPPGARLPASPGAPAWAISLPDIALDNLKVSAEDRRLSPPVPVQLDDLNIHVTGFTTSRSTPVAAVMSAKINREGKLDAKANLSPDLAAMKVQADLSNLDLTVLQPYIAQRTAMTLRSALLSTKLFIERTPDGHLTVGGEADLAKLHTVDNDLKLDFIKFERLQIAGIDYRWNSATPAKAASLHIHNITARAPYARVIIESDRTVNVGRVLSGPGGAIAPPTTPATRDQTERQQAKPPGAPAVSNAGAMAIAIDAINIQDGSANYADLWIQPHFAVGIQGLNGSILGLSSNPRARAKVELKGKVDRYAPVHIWGETNPLAATAYSDIRMSFKGVELTSATPYSGHFAGYKIEKGKLSVDIDYKIENRQLTAAHKFVIDQLELGDRVDSPDAIKLPLKIAIALLKDRKGVIDIDLPVTGSLDDPQFSIGPLVWKAVLNLLTKIATAPFAMLGRLFGGGEQMNYIDFEPGSAALAPSEHDKLAALAKALKEKDKLELDVPVTFSPDLDGAGLAARHLNTRLLAQSQQHGAGNKPGNGGAKTNKVAASTTDSQSPASTSQAPVPSGAPPEDPALTDPAQRYHLLVAVYRAELGKDTTLPASAQAVEAARHKKDRQPDFGTANAELETALLQKMPATDSELETLGKFRARAIQDVLLAGTDIDPARVFVIGSAPKGPAEKDKVRVELALK